MSMAGTGIHLMNLPRVDGEFIHELLAEIPTPSGLDDLSINSAYEIPMDSVDRAFAVEVMRWGTIYGYAQEQGGSFIQNLFPIKKFEDEQISSSSKVALELHTETAFHPYRPDFLSLLCVREDPRAGTVLAFLPDILQKLREETKVELRKDQFKTSLYESFKSDRQPDKEVTTSILLDNDQAIIYDRALMRGMNDAANQALSELSEVIDECSRMITLRTGQILTVDNRRCIHGRSPFSPKYDGSDRWLKRALIRVSPVPSSEVVWSQSRRIISTVL